MRKGYINANIYKNGDSAFLVDDNRIVKTGTDAEITRLLTKDEEVIDLQGMMVVPGFTDTHMHLLGLGAYLYNVPLDGCKSLADVRAKIEAYIAGPKMRHWIVGRGYNDDLFEIPGVVDKAFLDSISTEYPIAITRACGHKMVCNSKAFEEANIHPDTTFDGGRILYESGIVEEKAKALIQNTIPAPDDELLEAYIREAMAYCNRYGVTTCASDDFIFVVRNWRQVLRVMEKMSYREELTVRVNEQAQFPNPKEYAAFLDEGYTTDVGNDFFRIGPLKLVVDGSLGARTASLSRPYADAPERTGYLNMSEEDLELFVKLGARFNMGAVCHAIGDDAVDACIRAMEETIVEGNPLHSGLVHCQIMRPDQIQKIIDLKLSCYFQSIFIDFDSTILEDRVGDLSDSCYPFATLYRNTLASNGSDSPVEIPDALKGIQMAVTRKSTHEGYCMKPEECLTVEEAIDSFTSTAAKQLWMEDRIGSIQAGMLADFVVLDQDITKCDPETISAVKVMMTVMNGNTVYER